MQPGRRLRAGIFLGLVLGVVPALFAQTQSQYAIESGVRNNLSTVAGHTAPVGNSTAAPTGDPTITPQFANVVEASGGSSANNQNAQPNTTANGTANFPRSASVILTRSAVGTTFASGVPRYYFGDVIPPPTQYIDSTGAVHAAPTTYWRAQPVYPGETLAAQPTTPTDVKTGTAIVPLPDGTLPNYYYSPNAVKVFANTPGSVQVTWRSSVPESNGNYLYFTDTFSVSSVAAVPTRHIYWTERGFNGPLVQITLGQTIQAVNPVYSNAFPAQVSTEYADGSSYSTPILKTLWFDNTQSLPALHAYNVTGRILVEYLGNLKSGSATAREFLGMDVVDVDRQLPVVTATVNLGTQLWPSADGVTLQTNSALVPSTVGTNQSDRYASATRPDGSPTFYAEKLNTIADNVIFYWLEPLTMAIPADPAHPINSAIDWPKYQNNYLLVWPTNDSAYAHYTVDDGGSSATTGTGLPFSDGKIPSLVYWDSNGTPSIDAQSSTLFVSLTAMKSDSKTLLKFSGSNGAIWYVPLLTQPVSDLSSQHYSGTAYVGERLVPPSSDYSTVGYINVDPKADAAKKALTTSYSTTAYINPFTQGFTAAQQGTIIPVNALPNGQSSLRVWWFKKFTAPSAEFSDLYTPVNYAQYTLAYRGSNTVVSENFDAGATGWTNNLTTTISGTNKALGLFATYAVGNSTNVATIAAVTSKTFAVAGVTSDGLEINCRFYRVLTWDNEFFRVFVNDALVIDESYYLYTNYTTARTGSVTIGGVLYNWTITPYDDYFYAPYSQSFNVSIIATPTTSDGLASLANLKVGFGTNLDGPASDESMGIDDFSIRLPVPEIILASNQGTGDLSSSPINSGRIYNQPDPTKPGYNPNEEHALKLDDRGWALRDDLNVTSGTTFPSSATSGTGFTSEPRVLVEYADPTDGRPSMAVYEVLRENAIFKFDYPVTAPQNLNLLAPSPLNKLALPLKNGASANAEVDPGVQYHDSTPASSAPSYYSKFTFRDRKGYDWLYRGPQGGSTTSALGMKYYYLMRSDFAVPGRSVAEGTVLPYLRPIATTTPTVTYSGDPVIGPSLTVLYRPSWPDAPELDAGETLTKAKNGLPAVRGQSSAQVLYQQSIALGGNASASVELHDPTRAKFYYMGSGSPALTALPAGLKTSAQNGKTYFQGAPPHLQQRIYFNPSLGATGGIELDGQFVDVIAGEDYLNLNALSAADIAALDALVPVDDANYLAWVNAIASLTTTVQTFVPDTSKPGNYIPDAAQNKTVRVSELAEITSPNQAVDSYALTALAGHKTGYVTLVFGNSNIETFTPKGDPITLAVIKVADPLYQGDLKVLNASNPLDEQVTVRHSGDFAAKPEDYTFDWRYIGATSGSPLTYTYSSNRMVGSPSSNQWLVADNPSYPPGSGNLTYPATPALTLSNALQVNAATYVDKPYPASSTLPGSILPGKILKSTVGLNLTQTLFDSVIFSADLGTADSSVGFAVYVNGVPALAYRVPITAGVPGGLTLTDARSGLTSDALPLQFEIAPKFLVVDATGNSTNTIEVALFSAQGANSPSESFDFRISVPTRTDQVTDANGWTKAPSSLSNIVTLGGSPTATLGNPIFLYADAYFTMRYKRKVPTDSAYSDWTSPVLVENWVKRVLAGINPFDQRTTDLYNNPISTDVSILTQAGSRWEGDVALNLSSINDFGLIEIYETVLNRVKTQTLDAGVIDTGVNNTVILAAGYLNDLYMTLGDEAYDDAQNPTIQIDGQTDSSQINSARFAFEGQESTLIEETLALLRGRDDSTSTTTSVAPVYNRLYWNYTGGINTGEPIYAVNYDIKEKAGSPNANGVLNAADAQYMFPQGHGDAYGHYLTALTGYYRLLTSPSFSWVPSTDQVIVLGQTVEVDYKDERKFASAAAAVARTGVDILDFTARNDHRDGEEHGWGYQTDSTRHWGTDEWASRVYQGSYFNWVVANSLLPATSSKQGVQKIDRTTVPEIDEIVTSANSVLTLSSGLQAHLNTLGLPPDAMTFDVSPADITAGKANFEQIYDRAVKASTNARNAFNQAGKMNQLLRQQTNSLDDYTAAVNDQEVAYEYQLQTIYGTPYPGDVGPGKLYAQGYGGPDLYHSMFIDQPSGLVDTQADKVTLTFREPINKDPFTDFNAKEINDRVNDPTQYTARSYAFSKFTLAQFPPSDGSYGKRAQPGKIQGALLNLYKAQVNLREASNSYGLLTREFDRQFQLIQEIADSHDLLNVNSNAIQSIQTVRKAVQLQLNTNADLLRINAEALKESSDAASEAPPKVAGTSVDATSVIRSVLKFAGAQTKNSLELSAWLLDGISGGIDQFNASLDLKLDGLNDDYTYDSSQKAAIVNFEKTYNQVTSADYAIDRALSEVQGATEEVSKLYAEADHIQSVRQTFRQRAAAIIQGYRTRDLVYRTLRNGELSQYKSLFDLAQTYTYCAAKAYDYETGLLNSPEGEAFFEDIISTYSLGNFSGDSPISSSLGDTGLSGVLAGLRDEWSVVKGRLGFNNPDYNGTLFSLRQELFRVKVDQATPDDNTTWKQILQQNIKSNVLDDPDVAMYCANIAKSNGAAVPGIVIPFSTTIEQGLNFFGWPLAAGDHTFSQSTFSTKIYSSGVVFTGYLGMDPYPDSTNTVNNPASSSANALSATPYVYLIPAGVDMMRTPPLGGRNTIRSWTVRDQALPLPKNLGASAFSAQQLFTPQGTLNEQLWILRKFQAFRAVDVPAYFYSRVPAEYTNSRLIGRSVWNTRWKLVIPANSLLNNEQDGLNRFVNSVSDIKLFLRSYSNSGN